MRIDKWIQYDAIDRKRRLREIERPSYDVNIHKADLFANVFVLVILVVAIIYFTVG